MEAEVHLELRPDVSSQAIHRLTAAAKRWDQDETREQASSLRRILAAARPWLGTQRDAARESLAERVRQHRNVGTPPPLFRLMGLSDYEVPFNKLLGWALEPTSPMGRAALLGLTSKLHPVLAEEIRSGGRPDLHVERPWPPEVGLSTQPDLLVVGETGVLLIENKVWAGESGTGQYAGYLEAVECLSEARGGLDAAAYLLAREKRAAPEGWNGALTHSELAELLREATRQLTGTWDRISLTLVARFLEQPPLVLPLLTEADRLLELATPGIPEIARMLEIEAELRNCETPWSPDVDTELE